ncbi:MAG TPA: HAMP domain-containing sensor histidine kinase [Bacillales bacterium]|nr:HAMP domain-containing sensor histidine kinase [Bacillales bacterium]
MKKKPSRSLLKKYFVLIIIGLILLPVSFIIVQLFYYAAANQFAQEPAVHYKSQVLEKRWHRAAKKLKAGQPSAINKTLKQFRKKHPQSSVFWVDGTGKTRLELPYQKELPEKWGPFDSITFMKKSIGGDPFTVVAFISGNKRSGFMVFEMPRKYLNSTLVQFTRQYGRPLFFGGLSLIIAIFLAFMFVSYLFFNRIRKRLIRLQGAMNLSEEKAVPKPVAISKKDEIGDLEQSFNEMVKAVNESRRKEQEEESLRRQLIANLSHDLRTPLTALRGQIYALKEAVPEEKMQNILESADGKIHFMDELMDNLLSYTLLSSHKYPYHPEKMELVRTLRHLLAHWYETLEAEDFEIDISLPEHAMYCNLDPNWFRRMLDNVIQNVVRHASSGRYIGVRLTSDSRYHKLIISDKGPGFEEADPHSKGTGIGLSILSMMARNMNIHWDIESSGNGSRLIFWIPQEN